MSKRLNHEFIKERSLTAIARRLILNTEAASDKVKPDINLFFSVLDGEGKSQLLVNLLDNLSGFGYRILLLSPTDSSSDSNYQVLTYKIHNSFHRVESVFDLEADWSGVEFESFDYVFIEIPSILNHSYPIKLFRSAHHSFLITRANRAWSRSDKNSLKDILEYTKNNKPQVILNGVAVEEMETVLGDLPKRRSFIRRFVKNIIRLQFFSKNKLKEKSSAGKNKKRKYGWGVGMVLILLLLIVFEFVGRRYVFPKYFKSQPSVEISNVPETLESEKIDETEPSTELEAKIPRDSIKPEAVQQNNPPQISVRYYVIGGTFRSKENAEKCYNQYTQLGYSPYIFENTGDVYKVAVGVYDSKQKAEQVRNEFIDYVPHSDVWILVSTEAN